MGLPRKLKKLGKSISKGAKGAEKTVRKQVGRSADDARKAGGRAVVETGKVARSVVSAGDAVEQQLRHVVQQNMRLSPEALIDAVLGLFGIQPDKKLRLRISILRDERGVPVAGESDVRLALAETQRILGQQVHTKVVSAGGPLIHTLEGPAPREALDVHVDARAWEEDLGGAGWYFRQHAASSLVGETVGYAAPITAFVVRSIKVKLGCALGALLNYLTLDPDALKAQNLPALAHEIGHSCGLPHVKPKANLMYPTVGGDELVRAQRIVFRNSPHVTYV
jgi:hypothetical protein